MTRVLTITATARGGGAEAVARGLAAELHARGLASHMRVAAGEQTDLPWASPTPFDKRSLPWSRKLRYYSRRLIQELGVELCASESARQLLAGLPFLPDVIHCHNIRGNLLRLEDLAWLCRQAPVVWTLHDTWPITGHCGNPLDCERWRDRCGRCPYLKTPPPLRFDFTRSNLKRRRKLYETIARQQPGRLHLACPSQWLAGLTRESVARELPVHHAPNGIDPALYQPLPDERRTALRDSRSIPPEAFVVLFAAHKGRHNPFRDFPTFRTAVNALRQRVEGIRFVLVGDPESAVDDDEGNILSLGIARSPKEMAEAYALADLYVHVAKGDNQPLSVLEAMAGGTPVVATRLGGIPEMIEHQRTGLLVEPGDPEELAGAIARLKNDAPLRKELAVAARQQVEREFTVERMTDRYLSLYEQVLTAAE